MFQLKLITLVYISSLVYSTNSSENNVTLSIEKVPGTPLVALDHSNITLNLTKPNVSITNNESNSKTKTRDEQNASKVFFQPYPNEVDIPESFKMGFYFFIGLSIAGIIFILLKINGMRLSRAERKYGVHGDRSTQELTPLPMSIEDDSDNEDHTVFDINRQIRVS